MKAQTKDGSEIFYQVYDFTDPWKSAETVFLHHGSRNDHRRWFNWIPMVARHYRTLAHDARGRGRSTVPPSGFPWSMEQFATDVLAVLDDAGVERVHYVGTSFGGVVGQYLGANYPERLKSLTLITAPYRFTNLGEVKARWHQEMDTLGVGEFMRRDSTNLLGEDADPAAAAWFTQLMASLPDHVAKELSRFTGTLNLSDLLPRIAVPTLLLAATGSDRAPIEDQRFMQRQIPGSRLVEFDGRHHDIAFTMPERCAQAVLGFMREGG